MCFVLITSQPHLSALTKPLQQASAVPSKKASKNWHPYCLFIIWELCFKWLAVAPGTSLQWAHNHEIHSTAFCVFSRIFLFQKIRVNKHPSTLYTYRIVQWTYILFSTNYLICLGIISHYAKVKVLVPDHDLCSCSAFDFKTSWK